MLADHFIVEIDAHHGVRAELARFVFKLGQRNLARLAQGFLIRAGPAADNVANAGEQIAEQVRAQDRFAGDDALVVVDMAAFDRRGGGDDYGEAPSLLSLKTSVEAPLMDVTLRSGQAALAFSTISISSTALSAITVPGG